MVRRSPAPPPPFCTPHLEFPEPSLLTPFPAGGCDSNLCMPPTPTDTWGHVLFHSALLVRWPKVGFLIALATTQWPLCSSSLTKHPLSSSSALQSASMLTRGAQLLCLKLSPPALQDPGPSLSPSCTVMLSQPETWTMLLDPPHDS